MYPVMSYLFPCFPFTFSASDLLRGVHKTNLPRVLQSLVKVYVYKSWVSSFIRYDTLLQILKRISSKFLANSVIAMWNSKPDRAAYKSVDNKQLRQAGRGPFHWIM